MRGGWLETSARRPGFAAAVVAAVVAVGAVSASRLGFEPSYAALLPRDAPAVIELDEVRAALGGASDVFVVVTGEVTARRAFAARLADALTGGPGISEVAVVDREGGAVGLGAGDDVVGFFRERALYLIPPQDVRALADAVWDGYRAELRRSTALSLDDDDDDDVQDDVRDDVVQDDLQDDDGGDPWRVVAERGRDIAQRALDARLGSAAPRLADDSAREEGARGPKRNSYVIVRLRAASIETAAVAESVTAVRDAIARLDPQRAGVTAEVGGRPAISVGERDTMASDLGRATGIALVLVIALMAAVTRRVTAPLVIGAPLVASLVVTLGVTAALLGQLNMLSVFLLPALVGLGIDFGIHLYLAFLDARATPGFGDSARDLGDRVAAVVDAGDAPSPGGAMIAAIRATWRAAASSALTTAAAFGALLTVDFRGFRELGLLGAVGVLVTLAITYAALPPLALLVTRGQRRVRQPDTWRPSRRLAWSVVAVAAVGAFLAAAAVPGLRFQNRFTELSGDGPAIAVTEAIEDDLGLILSPAVVMVADVAAARRVEAAARSFAGPAPNGADGADGALPVRAALSIASLVPDDDAEAAAVRRAELARLAEGMDRIVGLADDDALARRSDRDRAALEWLDRAARARPWRADEIPASLRRRLVAADGSAVFALVWPDGDLFEDAQVRAWIRTLEALRRRVAEADPDVARAMRIFDERRLPMAVVDRVAEALPRTLAWAAALVALILLVQVRRPGRAAAVAASMALALVVTLAALVVTGIQVNAFNAVVLPIIVGVGIDNAIHIEHAHRRRGPGSLGRVLQTTGRAALLASLTTAIGFGAAMTAHQGGLARMGLTAVIGVAAALVATTVVLPAALRLGEPR